MITKPGSAKPLNMRVATKNDGLNAQIGHHLQQSSLACSTVLQFKPRWVHEVRLVSLNGQRLETKSCRPEHTNEEGQARKSDASLSAETAQHRLWRNFSQSP